MRYTSNVIPTVDAIIEKNGKILLIRRRKEPFTGSWALPGGWVDEGETVEEAVVRETREETGLDVSPIAITGVYSQPGRDPRGNFITISFVCEVISGEERVGEDVAEVKWFPLDTIPELAFDHGQIVEDYKKWKREKGTYWSTK